MNLPPQNNKDSISTDDSLSSALSSGEPAQASGNHLALITTPDPVAQARKDRFRKVVLISGLVVVLLLLLSLLGYALLPLLLRDGQLDLGNKLVSLLDQLRGKEEQTVADSSGAEEATTEETTETHVKEVEERTATRYYTEQPVVANIEAISDEQIIRTVETNALELEYPLTASAGVNMGDALITNLGNPLEESNAVSKSYVDSLAGSVSWDTISNMPAGFADDVDNDTTYSGGNQIGLSGTTFNVIEGSGSDLDADLLDGQDSAYYLNVSNINAGTLGVGYYSAYSDLLAEGYVPAASTTIWTNTNDGPGSGLNSDLLDGVSGGSFLRSDTSDNYTSGTLTLNAGTTIDVNGDMVVSDQTLVFDAATFSAFDLSGDLRILATGDDDDYIYFNTTANVPGVFWEGTGAVTDPGLYTTGQELGYRDESDAWVSFDSIAAGAALWSDGGTYLFPTSGEDIQLGDGDWIGVGTGANQPYLMFDDTWDDFAFMGAYVGIGTINPLAELVVKGDNPQINLQPDDTDAGLLAFYNSAGSTPQGSIKYDNNADDLFVENINAGNLIFETSNTEQMRMDSSGNVGIGTTDPTAYLHLKAGTASAGTAPLKFTSGTNLTTPEAGAMEWDGTNLYITQTAGPTRKTIAYTTDIPGGAGLWESGASATYEDDDDVVVGSSGGSTIATGFSLSGDDLFVASLLGVEGAIYTDDDLYLQTDVDTTGAGNITINFGGTNTETLIWDATDDRFEFSDDVHADGFVTGATLTLHDDYIRDTGDINLQADGDTDDYLYIDTTGDVPGLLWEGIAAQDPGIYVTGTELGYRDEADSWVSFDSIAEGAALWTDGGTYLTPTGGKDVQLADGDWIGVGSGANQPYLVFDDTGDDFAFMGGDVGIGTTGPDSTLHIYKNSAGAVSALSETVLTIEDSATAFISFLTPNDAKAGLWFGDPEDNDVGRIEYLHSSNALTFYTSFTEQMRIDTSGYVGIGTTAPGTNLEVAVSSGGIKLSDSGDSYNERGTLGNVAGSGGYLRLYDDSEAQNVLIRSYGDSYFMGGDIGIGTTDPSFKLEVGGAFGANLTTVGSGTANLTYNAVTKEIQYNSSTIKHKENIRDLTFDKETFLKLRPVAYNSKRAYGGQPGIGFIAEEVVEIMPDMVFYAPKKTYIGNDGEVLRDENGNPIEDPNELQLEGVKYDQLPLYLFLLVREHEEGLQTLSKRVEEQQLEIDSLSARLDLIDSPEFTNATVLEDFLTKSLVVEGDATLAGALVIHGDVTVYAGLKVLGHITVGEDTAGEVTIPTGETYADVEFSAPYETPPVITLGVEEGSASSEIHAWITNKTREGFRVNINTAQGEEVKVNWIVVEME